MKKLGEDPETGLEVTLRSGRFGPYIQRGEAVNGEKPKRAGIPKGLTPDDIDLQRALGLLSLPREIGKHPEDGEPILAGVGRFGPYVQHGKTYANLEAGDEVLNVGLNRAVTLIAEKKLNPGKGRRFGADPGRPLGDHPDKGGPVVVKKGRYGPYVSHDGVNATLPSDIAPETVTLEQALPLLDARAAMGGGGRKKKAAKPSKAAAKKAAAEAKAETTTPAKAKAPKKAAKAAKSANGTEAANDAPANAKPAKSKAAKKPTKPKAAKAKPASKPAAKTAKPAEPETA
jgi:DNA topoisomerase-1